MVKLGNLRKRKYATGNQLNKLNETIQIFKRNINYWKVTLANY